MVVLDCSDCMTFTPLDAFLYGKLQELRVELGELITLLTGD